MKRWALVVVVAYGLIGVALLTPVLVFATGSGDAGGDLLAAYAAWPYWLWVVAMLLAQALLLVVPVRIASRRPVTRRSLLLPTLVTGLMLGVLAVGAAFALLEFTLGDDVEDGQTLAALGIGVLAWTGWTAVFAWSSRDVDPRDFIARQCRFLLAGSILELLIAVPTHIVVRSRDYCCAGLLTFLGIALGIPVMLFAFGPAVYFLYAERYRRLHPARAEVIEVPPTE